MIKRRQEGKNSAEAPEVSFVRSQRTQEQSRKGVMNDPLVGKKVGTLVEEQLRYCRSLRQVDLQAITQHAATDEGYLKRANSIIMLLKADVRALDACAAIFLPLSEADHTDQTTNCSADASEVAVSAYGVERTEQLLRRFRQVDTVDSSNGIVAMSRTNKLVAIRERLQAGVSARLLRLKDEMDKEFGPALADLESCLRTEIDTQAKPDATEHCSTCARLFVDLCHKFQARGDICIFPSQSEVMVHTCRGLRSAKEGLNLAILVKTLRKERDGIAERLTGAEAELKRIHHSYTEMMTPEVAASLENRQQQRIEEQHVDIGRLTADIASFKRDQERLVAENGRLTDALADLQTQLEINKEKHGRELAWLAPKIDTAENRAADIDGLMDQMNLRLSLLGSSHKKACEEVRDLKAQLAEVREKGTGGERSRREAQRAQDTIRRLQAEVRWKDRLVTVAISAKTTAQDEYREMKHDAEELERRLRETQGSCTLLKAQKDKLTKQLMEEEASLAAAEDREAGLREEVRKMAEEIGRKALENEVLQERRAWDNKRLDNQELELRNASSLQKEHQELEASNKASVYQLHTISEMFKVVLHVALFIRQHYETPRSLGPGRS
ncbi:unnamed protein product [Ascophyllum nodosum]